MFAPLINPYEPSMTKEEMRGTWDQWSSRRKLLYFLARKFPKFLAYFYHRSFLSGNHGQIDKWMSQSLGKKVNSCYLKLLLRGFKPFQTFPCAFTCCNLQHPFIILS